MNARNAHTSGLAGSEKEVIRTGGLSASAQPDLTHAQFSHIYVHIVLAVKKFYLCYVHRAGFFGRKKYPLYLIHSSRIDWCAQKLRQRRSLKVVI